jgi:hypothetical protein
MMSMMTMAVVIVMTTHQIVRIRSFHNQNRIVLGHFVQTGLVKRHQISVIFQLVINAFCCQWQARFVSTLERLGLLLIALLFINTLICLHVRIQIVVRFDLTRIVLDAFILLCERFVVQRRVYRRLIEQH